MEHLVPLESVGQVIGSPLSAANSAARAGCYTFDDVNFEIWAQTSMGVYELAGFEPLVSDGNGGLAQLARHVNAQYMSKPTTSGFGASVSGTTLTTTFPTINVFWNSSVQTVQSGSYAGSVASGTNTYSLVVGYQWGLTAFSYVLTSSLDPTANGVEICRINVNTVTVTAAVVTGAVNGRWMGSLAVNGPASTSYSISTSNGSSIMPW
jgi:hypothetical protein